MKTTHCGVLTVTTWKREEFKWRY